MKKALPYLVLLITIVLMGFGIQQSITDDNSAPGMLFAMLVMIVGIYWIQSLDKRSQAELLEISEEELLLLEAGSIEKRHTLVKAKRNGAIVFFIIPFAMASPFLFLIIEDVTHALKVVTMVITSMGLVFFPIAWHSIKSYRRGRDYLHAIEQGDIPMPELINKY